MNEVSPWGDASAMRKPIAMVNDYIEDMICNAVLVMLCYMSVLLANSRNLLVM